MASYAYAGRGLMQAAAPSNQDTAPFFGFIGAASALVFSCEQLDRVCAMALPLRGVMDVWA